MIISLNEGLRRVSKDLRLCEDDHEANWSEDDSGPRRDMKSPGTVTDAEAFISRMEATSKGPSPLRERAG